MKKISTKKFDEMFDNNESTIDYLDTSKIASFKELKENIKFKSVNIDFPEYIVYQLDKQAKKIGITRQSLIKIWISENYLRKMLIYNLFQNSQN